MSVTYGPQGLQEYDTITGTSNVSSFDVDVDDTASVTLIFAQYSFSSEAPNYNARMQLLNSSGTAQSCSYRTWANGTTNTFASSNTTSVVTNYWNVGAANTTSMTGEHYRIMLWLFNDISTTTPLQSVTFYGKTSWEGTGGNTGDVMFGGRSRGSSLIHKVRFLPQANSINKNRCYSWTVADT